MTASPTIRLRRPVDPFRQEIDRRKALKLAAERRETIPPSPTGTAALYAGAKSIRANPVHVAFEVERC